MGGLGGRGSKEEQRVTTHQGQSDAEHATGDGVTGVTIVSEKGLNEEHAIDGDPGNHEEDLKYKTIEQRTIRKIIQKTNKQTQTEAKIEK